MFVYAYMPYGIWWINELNWIEKLLKKFVNMSFYVLLIYIKAAKEICIPSFVVVNADTDWQCTHVLMCLS